MSRLVNGGLPRDVSCVAPRPQGRLEVAVADRCRTRRIHLDGDGQGGHDGERRATMVDQPGSYRYWESYLHRDDCAFVRFGGNCTVEGLSDDEICIGDRIGGALLEELEIRPAQDQ